MHVALANPVAIFPEMNMVPLSQSESTLYLPQVKPPLIIIIIIIIIIITIIIIIIIIIINKVALI